VHPEKIKSNKRIMPSNEYFSKIENLAILIPPLFFDNVNLPAKNSQSGTLPNHY